MKKTFLKLNSLPVYRLPRISSRRMGNRGHDHHAYSAYQSDGDDPAKEAEKQALLKSIQTQFEAELEKRAYTTKTDAQAAIEEAMKAFKDLDVEAIRTYKADKEALQATLNTMGLAIRAMEEKAAQYAAAGIPSRQTIAAQLRAFFTDPKNKEAIEAFRRGDSKSLGTDSKGDAAIFLEHRAAATMTVSGSTGSSAFVPNVEVTPGLVDLARNRPFLEDYSNTTTTTSSRIVWTEKYNPQGNAAFTAEGGVKPLISFEVRTLESYAKKVTDKIKVSTEMLDDIDFMAAEIESELKYQVDIAVDTALLAGSGDGTVNATDIKGLDAYVGGYVLTSIATVAPNNYDAIRASIGQIVSLNFVPNALFYNPIDAANMDLVKDKNDRPLAVEYKMADGTIYRLRPVETNQIPQGSFLIGDMTRFKVRNYKPFAISYGLVNDDFEKNLRTILGERRLHCYVASNDVGAFVYDTFANVKTAILAA